MSRRHAVAAVCALGVRRVVGRLRGAAPGRTAVCILGVAVAVGLLMVITGLSLGIATGSTVEAEDVNYWIVPDNGDTGSVPLSTDGTRLSEVHTIARRLQRDERVTYATPVAIQPLRVHDTASGDHMYVLAVGVVPADQQTEVAGINVSTLNTTYPHYANGTYEGPWTGDAVITPGVTAELGVETGDELAIGDSSRRLQIQGTNEEDLAAGVNEIPAIAMPLAELQSTTGLSSDDQADQILVRTTDPSVRGDLEGIYPRTEVVSRSGLSGIETTPTNLPLAMALAATLVAGGIGVAFVGTMMGLEITAGRRELAAIAAIGFSQRSRVLLTVAETMTVAVLGGLLGVLLGTGGIGLVNAGVARTIGVPAIATLSLPLAGYAFATALVVGLLSVPYPLYLVLRTDTLEELTR